MSEPAVEVRELTRRFGGFTAVDRVSFAVAPGEIFGFLGSNGAGKTTTIKMLTGLLAPSGGEGRVAGHDIVGERPAIRQSIAFSSQHSFTDSLANEGEMMNRTGATEDHAAAVAAFVAKEKPVFHAR